MASAIDSSLHDLLVFAREMSTRNTQTTRERRMFELGDI